MSKIEDLFLEYKLLVEKAKHYSSLLSDLQLELEELSGLKKSNSTQLKRYENNFKKHFNKYIQEKQKQLAEEIVIQYEEKINRLTKEVDSMKKSRDTLTRKELEQKYASITAFKQHDRRAKQEIGIIRSYLSEQEIMTKINTFNFEDHKDVIAVTHTIPRPLALNVKQQKKRVKIPIKFSKEKRQSIKKITKPFDKDIKKNCIYWFVLLCLILFTYHIWIEYLISSVGGVFVISAIMISGDYIYHTIFQTYKARQCLEERVSFYKLIYEGEWIKNNLIENELNKSAGEKQKLLQQLIDKRDRLIKERNDKLDEIEQKDSEVWTRAFQEQFNAKIFEQREAIKVQTERITLLKSQINELVKNVQSINSKLNRIDDTIGSKGESLVATKGKLKDVIYIITEESEDVIRPIYEYRHNKQPFVITYTLEEYSQLGDIIYNLLFDILLAFKRNNCDQIFKQLLVDEVERGIKFLSKHTCENLHIEKVTGSIDEVKGDLQECYEMRVQLARKGQKIHDINAIHCREGKKPYQYTVIYYVFEPGRTSAKLQDDVRRLLPDCNKYGFLPIFICDEASWIQGIAGNSDSMHKQIKKVVCNRIINYRNKKYYI